MGSELISVFDLIFPVYLYSLERREGQDLRPRLKPAQVTA